MKKVEDIQFDIVGDLGGSSRYRSAKGGRQYISKRQVDYRERARKACSEALCDRHLPGPYNVFVLHMQPLPKSRLRKNSPDISCNTRKPDLDNVLKGLLDSIFDPRSGRAKKWAEKLPRGIDGDDAEIIMLTAEKYEFRPGGRFDIYEGEPYMRVKVFGDHDQTTHTDEIVDDMWFTDYDI